MKSFIYIFIICLLAGCNTSSADYLPLAAAVQSDTTVQVPVTTSIEIAEREAQPSDTGNHFQRFTFKRKFRKVRYRC